MTRVLPGLPRLTPTDLAEVLALFARDEPVGLPTETVYGLAAPALSPRACRRIFALKDRPYSDPLICHLPSPAWLEKMTTLDPATCSLAQALIAAFWPGPLTLVLPRSAIVPDVVTAGQETVAVRQSAHPVFQQVIEAYGAPLAAPSANRFGRISPTKTEHVLAELGDRLSLVVDGGDCQHGLESTIVALSSRGIEILRPGPILSSALQPFASVTAPPRLSSTAITGSPQLTAPIVPGTMAAHYAPRTRLTVHPAGHLPHGTANQGLLAWQKPAPGPWGHIEILTPDGNPEKAATKFYAALRRLDEAGLAEIIAEFPPADGLAAVLQERLLKAAAAHLPPPSPESAS